jgi:DNA helicase-2/ATP-dependent DNA helicase PcrA
MGQLLIDLIDALPAGHPLRRDSSDAYYEVKRLVPLFQDMKREGWSVAQLLLTLEEYRVDQPDLEEFQYSKNLPARSIRAGDPRQQELAAEENKIAKSAAAIELFNDYQRALRELGRYDYDDMLGWSIGLLTDHPHVLLGY